MLIVYLILQTNILPDYVAVLNEARILRYECSCSIRAGNMWVRGVQL
jgi:hypothetical protein